MGELCSATPSQGFESHGHARGAGGYNDETFIDVARNTCETQLTHTLL